MERPRRRYEIPWTPEEVASLVEYQKSRKSHPYTCNGGNPRFDSHHDHEVLLVPTPDGFVCPECSRVQDWV